MKCSCGRREDGIVGEEKMILWYRCCPLYSIICVHYSPLLPLVDKRGGMGEKCARAHVIGLDRSETANVVLERSVLHTKLLLVVKSWCFPLTLPRHEDRCIENW